MTTHIAGHLAAGAAIVGLSTFAAASSVPAHADSTTDLVYSCPTPAGPQTLELTITTDLPDGVAAYDEFTFTPAISATLDGAFADAMADDWQWQEVEVGLARWFTVDLTSPVEGSVSPLLTTTAPRTAVPTDGALQVDFPDQPQTTRINVPGTYDLLAPTDFPLALTGYDADGSAGDSSPVTSTCTYVSGDRVSDTMTIGPGAPGDDIDWYKEPDSIETTADGRHFVVGGTTTRPGEIRVTLLDADEQELTKYVADFATAGPQHQVFAFLPGTAYVNLTSEDCVDGGWPGGDQTFYCDVTYPVSWADDSDDSGGASQGGDAADGGSAPQVPAVVQTDGVRDSSVPGDGAGAVLALGAALLAGAGTVLVARRASTSRP